MKEKMNKGKYLGITNSGFLTIITLNQHGTMHENTTQVQKAQSFNQSYGNFINENKNLIKPKNELFKMIDDKTKNYPHVSSDMYNRIFLQLFKDYTQENYYNANARLVNGEYEINENNFYTAYKIYEENKDNINELGDVDKLVIDFMDYKLKDSADRERDIENLIGKNIKGNNKIPVIYQGKEDFITEYNIFIERLEITNDNFNYKGTAKSIKLEKSDQTFTWINF